MFWKKSYTFKSLYQPIRILSQLPAKSYYILCLSLFLMIISSLAESFTILSITDVISRFQSNTNPNLNSLIQYKRLYSIFNLDPLQGFIVIIIFSASLRIFTLWFNSKTSSFLGNQISKKVFYSIINWPYQKHIEVNSSILIATLTQFTKSAVGTINNFLLIINSLLITIAISITLIKVNAKVSISLILIIYFSYLVNNLIVRNYLKESSKTIKNKTLKTFKIIKESLEGIKDVIINDRRSNRIESFSEEDKILKDSVVFAKFISTYPKYVFEATIIIGILLLLNNYDPKNEFNNIAQLSIFAFGSQKLLPSIQQIYSSITAIKYAGNKTESLLEIIEGEYKNSKQYLSFENNKQINNTSKKVLFNESLELKSIYFKYKKDKSYIIKNFNLNLSKGEFIAIMGPSGSGKTSIIDIIMGLLPPEKGSIKVDQRYIFKDKNFYDLKNWQNSINHVSQNVYLLDTNIRKNIIMDNSHNYTEEGLNDRLEEIIEITCLKELIDSLPNGIYENVGERGSLLSGGQIQRIGIARALFNEKPLIIFDEATSALDSNTEDKFLSNIRNFCTKSSLIMITHKKKPSLICDRIIEI